eukprot:Lankesteria_metandrocarpae@DN4283_c1_g1_i1.p1
MSNTEEGFAAAVLIDTAIYKKLGYDKLAEELKRQAGPRRTIHLDGKDLKLEKAVNKSKRRRKSLVRLSRRSLRKLGLLEIEKDLSYDALRPLNHLWNQYAQSILGLSCHSSFNFDDTTPACISRCNRLSQADLHGALLRVERSLYPRWVGINGIVVTDSETSLALICRPPRSVRRGTATVGSATSAAADSSGSAGAATVGSATSAAADSSGSAGAATVGSATSAAADSSGSAGAATVGSAT